MEKELILTGIGGQGVQLAAQVLARAAAREDRFVMVFGLYGGMMRGGSSDSSVVVADSPIEAPPVISSTWSAIVMHHKYSGPTFSKLRPGSVVLLNSSLFEGHVDRGTYQVFEVPATSIAAELGNEMAASMVMAGGYVGVTGLVALDSATAAVVEALPPYRRQHVELNQLALRAGYESVEQLRAPAWETTGAAR